MSCQASFGLLVLRECGQPAAGACSSCGKMLCAMHQVMGPGGMACPECSVAAGVQSDQTQDAANRQGYYTTYGQQRYFTEDDHSAARPSAARAQHGYDPLDT